jgi:hypothetical protein
LVVEKAVPPSRAGAAAASRDYVLLAFLRDRTEAKAGVKILLSADRQQLGNSNVGYTKGGQMLNYGGWMVAMLPVNFKPFGKDDLYAKVVYTPGRDATGGTRMVATYALGGEQAGL